MMRSFAKRILVPSDFSESSDRALDTAIALARLFGASVDVLHVYQPPAAWGLDGMILNFPEIEAALKEQIAKPLGERAEKVRAAGLPCDESRLQGRPADEIVGYARAQNVDLIVMGTHGRTGLRHALLGSVAERVVQKAHCPVMVVPPAGLQKEPHEPAPGHG